MGPFNLAVELRGTGFDVGVANALVFDVPVELRLKLVSVIRSDLTNAEGELFDDVVDERNGAGLVVALIDFECSDAGGIVDGRALVSFDRFVVFTLESQKLNINLNLMTRHLLLVTLSVDFAEPCAAWKPADAIALEDTINASTRYFDVVVAGQIPDDADWPEMINLPKVQDLLNNGRRGLLRMRSCDGLSADQANITVHSKRVAPQIKV